MKYTTSCHALRQEPLDQPLDETRPPADSPDLSPYDRSKAAADKAGRAGLAFAVWTFANLAPRAWANHVWYLRNFPDYLPGRKALIPGLW